MRAHASNLHVVTFTSLEDGNVQCKVTDKKISCHLSKT